MRLPQRLPDLLSFPDTLDWERIAGVES